MHIIPKAFKKKVRVVKAFQKKEEEMVCMIQRYARLPKLRE